ncbi:MULTISPECIES: glycosyltransferase family 39 protein [unclassified Nostoc]|uniref:glycosyltransferase family 39 protein n=1 Tax=unclassified Nostoc TaxID=2593658 RepID=UPI002AD54A4D|nr:glycosyltransferase family 39 protein [Nostoc sp. DedQUE03]MDZ7974681.1 glycosyltransferase family 39 protein [Nostoc sp. DedQUE03]MDZ8049313.1 glycosyltransferase family 39 protein [Nostoc sp. DedQUE02]
MIKILNQRWSKYYISVLIVIFLSVFLRFFMLSNQSFWFDEGLSLNNSDASTIQESISRVRHIRDSDKFQPLYFIVLFLWRQVFGESEFALRSLSAVLGIGSTIVIFFTALRIYGKKHAFWSLLIVTFSSFCVYYSQEARIYALAMFIASLQLYFFSTVLVKKKGNQAISIWLFSIFTAIGIFTNINFYFSTVALCISHFVIYRNFRQWLQWWLPAGFLSLPPIFYYFTLPGATNPESVSVSRLGFPIIQNIIFVLNGILVGTTYGPSTEQLRGDDKVQVMLHYWPHILLLVIVATVIFLALIKVLLRHKKNHRNQHPDYFFACVFVMTFLLGLLLAIVTKFNWVPRHSYYLWFPLAMLIPSVLSPKPGISSKRYGISYLAKIAVISLIVLNIYSLFNYYFNNNYQKDDYRSAAQYLIKNQSPSTKSVFLFASARLLRHYGYTQALNGSDLGNQLRKGIVDEHFAEKIEQLTSNADIVLIVVNREHLFPKGLIEKQMSDLYNLDSQVNFTYFKIYRFPKKRN